MPNPVTGFKDSNNVDLGNILITKEYLMSVYPQIAGQLITPELWGWGGNFGGSIGDNTTNVKSTPVTTFAGGANWKQVSGDTGAIKTDGTLWMWGANSYGRIGNNVANAGSTISPVTTFAGGTNWKQVSAKNGFVAAIKTDGTLWTWGRNNWGQIGDNTITDRCTPVTTFAGGTNWKQVNTGSAFAAAIKTDGTLWTWGYNGYGQLGDNTTTQRNTPVTTFAGGTNWKQVSAGGGHIAAIKTDGTLWTWGGASGGFNVGQLGDNTGTNKLTPVTTFAGGTNWKQVSCGGHTIAVKTDGTLWVWGGNSRGQVGDNTTVNRSTPVTTFAGGTNWKQVACGGARYAVAIKTDGTLWTWGNNAYGQLGDNVNATIIYRSTPVTTFAGGTNWKQVDCGFQNMMAIKTSDDLQGI